MKIVSPFTKEPNKYIKFEEIAMGEVFLDCYDQVVYIKTENCDGLVLNGGNTAFRCGEIYADGDFIEHQLMLISDAKLQTAFFDNK